MKFHTMGCVNNSMLDRNKQFITADWERIIMVNALVIKKRNEFMHPRTIPPATPVYAPLTPLTAIQIENVVNIINFFKYPNSVYHGI